MRVEALGCGGVEVETWRGVVARGNGGHRGSSGTSRKNPIGVVACSQQLGGGLEDVQQCHAARWWSGGKGQGTATVGGVD